MKPDFVNGAAPARDVRTQEWPAQLLIKWKGEQTMFLEGEVPERFTVRGAWSRTLLIRQAEALIGPINIKENFDD